MLLRYLDRAVIPLFNVEPVKQVLQVPGTSWTAAELHSGTAGGLALTPTVPVI